MPMNVVTNAIFEEKTGKIQFLYAEITTCFLFKYMYRGIEPLKCTFLSGTFLL